MFNYIQIIYSMSIILINIKPEVRKLEKLLLMISLSFKVGISSELLLIDLILQLLLLLYLT
jgi:hypothetical protein